MNSLLTKKLATGGQFVYSPARFLWKGEVIDMDYVTIHCYSLERLLDDLIGDVRTTSGEEVPMITASSPDHLNDELAKWIERTLRD